MKNVVFRNVMPCAPCKNVRFGDPIVSIIRVTRIGELGTTLAVNSNRRTLPHIIFLRSVRLLLLTANVVPSSQILVTLMMESLHSFETSDRKCAIRSNIPEEDILHC
jgi:hypothetical protein